MVEPVERLGDRHDVDGLVRRGIDSAVPASGIAPGTADRSCASISGIGSTAVTRCPSATSERVSFPVPAPRSTTSQGSSPASHRAASSG